MILNFEEEIDPERDSVESSILKNILNRDSTERMLKFPLKAFQEENDLSFSKKLKTEGDEMDEEMVVYTKPEDLEEPHLKLNEIINSRVRSKTIYINNASPSISQNRPEKKYGYTFVGNDYSNDFAPETEKKVASNCPSNNKGTLRGKENKSLNSQNLKSILRMLTSSLERSDFKKRTREKSKGKLSNSFISNVLTKKRRFLPNGVTSPKEELNKENVKYFSNHCLPKHSKGKSLKKFGVKSFGGENSFHK